jgi:hypothetical protein
MQSASFPALNSATSNLIADMSPPLNPPARRL